MTLVWNEDLKGRVKALWDSKSARDIAALLMADGYPVSRNSVIGVVHRMGLTCEGKPRPTPQPRVRNPKPQPDQFRIVSSAPLPDKEDEGDIGPWNIRGIDPLQFRHCRFICNDDMTAPIFCGRDKQIGPWCRKHSIRCSKPRVEA